ncbi:MAG: molybdopterin converting factor subunit 1 [Gemmatimonadaceae bacterium]|nr:molybdopterin converting factor subunit 1 [Acetobacteraceae bacterium]
MATLLYFAWVRERMGRAEEALSLPPGIGTVGALVGWLHGRDAGGAAAFAEAGLVRAAVNQDFAGPDTPIGDADEIAFFPPVTGG